MKLLASPNHSAALSVLAKTFAKACNAIAPCSVEHRCWNRVALHHLAYYPVRALFPSLGSQMVCQAVHRVADAYKTLKANNGIAKDKPVPIIKFDKSSVNFDKRTYSIKGDILSLFTLDGRIKVPFAAGKHQRNLLNNGVPKEAKLIVLKGIWYFNIFLDLPDTPPITGSGVCGVDVGEKNLAATSTGKVWGGGQLRHNRDKYLANRRRLQANGSRAAKRKLHAKISSA